MAYKLKHYFTDFTLDVYEKNGDVGGAWLQNRYPGCACDVPAHIYTYSFEPKWDWSANYAGSAEIFEYFSSFVTNAAWGQDVEFGGKNVGLIGNGWIIGYPNPARDTAGRKACYDVHRPPSWISPQRGMEYYEYMEDEKARFRDEPGALLNMRKEAENRLTGIFPLFIQGSTMQEATRADMTKVMAKKIGDEELAQKLTPGFAPGVNYPESLNMPNVTTVYGKIMEVTADGCVTEDGQTWPLDALICATGFDTTFKPPFPVIGRGGHNLVEQWAGEPKSYLGLAVNNFPNYFMYLGPNCPIGNGPIIFAIELQGEYIARFLNRWQKENLRSVDPQEEAVNDFIQQKDAFMTLGGGGVEHRLTPHYMENLDSPRYDDYKITYRDDRFVYLGNGSSRLNCTQEQTLASIFARTT
ncbi:hypothetical protein BDW62DRAFT_200878 [Aspergillus aurantiobrunneus]